MTICMRFSEFLDNGYNGVYEIYINGEKQYFMEPNARDHLIAFRYFGQIDNLLIRRFFITMVMLGYEVEV